MRRRRLPRSRSRFSVCARLSSGSELDERGHTTGREQLPAEVGGDRVGGPEQSVEQHGSREVAVERVIGPDSTILADFMLHRLTGIVRDLVVHPEKMTENLQETKGLIFSQQVLMKLAQKGVERQKAYDMVQRNAMRAWESRQEFKQLIMEDREIGEYLNNKEIEDIFDLDYHLKHVDEIYKRVFSQD